MHDSIFKKAKQGRAIAIATIDAETLGLGVNSQVMTLGYGIGVWSPSARGSSNGAIYACEEYKICSDSARETSQDVLDWHTSDSPRRAVLAEWAETNASGMHLWGAAQTIAHALKANAVDALLVQGKDFDMGLISSCGPTAAKDFQDLSGVPYYNTHCLRDLEAFLAGTSHYLKYPRNKLHTAKADCEDNLLAAFAAFSHIYNNR